MSGVGGGQRSIEAGLNELLEWRAGRSKVDPTLVARVAAHALASPQDRIGWWAEAVRSLAPARRTAASLAALVVVVSLVGAALFVGGGARPSVSPSPRASGLVAGPTQLMAYRFTSVDFLRYLREEPGAFVGHTILVDGALHDVADSCYRASFDCPPMGFADADPHDPHVIPGDETARDAVGKAAAGTFAIEVTAASDLRLLGVVEPPSSGEFWRPDLLADRSAPGPQLYAVDGYLGVTSHMIGCPLVGGEPNFCPPAWISDEPDPASSGGNDIPSGAIRIPAYFAETHGAPALRPRVLALVRSAAGSPCVAGCTAITAGKAWLVVSQIDPVELTVSTLPDTSASPAEASARAVDDPVAMSEADLKHQLDANGSALIGKVVLVRGSIQTAKPCKGVNCPTGVFGSLGSAVGVFDGGDQPNLPVSGILAVRIVDAHAVRFVGRLVPNDARVTWRPLELARYGPPNGTDLYAVTGWLVPQDGESCPANLASGQGGCDGRPAQLVEDEATARTLLGGQKVESLLLESVASEVEPTDAEAGTYLVRAATIPPCGPNADCLVPPDAPVGLIVDARVDSIVQQPTPQPTPSATETATATAVPPSVTGYLPGGVVRAVEGEPVLYGLDTQIAIEQSTDATPFLIGGWYGSRFLPICSGPVGQDDPNPLGRRSCQSVLLDGGPRDLYFPPGLVLPDGDAPIVLRVHTHDPSADTCLEADQAFCRSRPVIDDVVWFGDAQTRGQPMGPAEAKRRLESLPIEEGRSQPDGSIAGVAAHQFVTPHICADPDQSGWPPDLFAIHGDPRLGLVAVFPSIQARADFAASHPPAAGVTCTGAPAIVVRPGEPNWIALDNVLVLSFGDDAFNRAVGDALKSSHLSQQSIGFADPDLDLAGNTVWDYVEGRAFGDVQAVLGYRLVSSQGPGWLLDVERRARATALFGTIASVAGPVSEQQVGSAVWKQIQGTDDRRLFTVHYPGATDPALADETFVAVYVPKSTFLDWELFRVDGAAYPSAP